MRCRPTASTSSSTPQQTGGRRLRVDTFQARLDVTFFRLSQTDAQIIGSGAYVRDRIEAELRAAAGMLKSGKLYAVFYGGGSAYACGGGAWPPTLPGVVAAMYLKGTPSGSSCALNRVGASATVPGYADISMVHELLHTMGIVGSCAPHFTQAGHVSDDPRDLMYAGPLRWRPSILDLGHDGLLRSRDRGLPGSREDVMARPVISALASPPRGLCEVEVRRSTAVLARRDCIGLMPTGGGAVRSRSRQESSTASRSFDAL
jgi:hypothetical protein